MVKLLIVLSKVSYKLVARIWELKFTVVTPSLSRSRLCSYPAVTSPTEKPLEVTTHSNMPSSDCPDDVLKDSNIKETGSKLGERHAQYYFDDIVFLLSITYNDHEDHSQGSGRKPVVQSPSSKLRNRFRNLLQHVSTTYHGGLSTRRV